MNQTTLKLLEFEHIQQQLADLSISEAGRARCLALLPETDPGIIADWLDETREARAISERGSGAPLTALAGVEKTMQRMKQATALSPEELMTLRQLMLGAARMIRYMADKIDVAPRVAAYAKSMFDLSALGEEIGRVIIDNRVDDRASSQLSRTRKRIFIVESRIQTKLDSILRAPEMQTYLMDKVVGMRGGNYVIPVRREHRKSVDGMVLDLSSTGSTVFVEPAAIRELKNELDLLRLEEEQEVFRILSELTTACAGYTRELSINIETMVHYDFLFAKAKLARQMQAVMPVLNTKGIVRLMSARHPMLGKEAVPLDCEIGVRFRALVITGPNTGGKTVVLKTVGLLTLMAQAGLYIPAAAGSEIAIFTDVLADIGDGQSITQSLSTFSSHIRNIISILACAGKDTLVIIDELGTGTDPAEGMGIAISVMEALYRQGAVLLATTHYSEIKAFAANTPGFENGCMSFSVETLKPLFRLTIGKPGESNAFLISLRLGMPPEIINRAHSITYNEEHLYVRPQFASDQQDKPGSSTQEDLPIPVMNKEMIAAREHAHEVAIARMEARKTVEKQKVHSDYKLGDCVFVTTMNRTGIVCEAENTRGELGVMIMKKKIMVNQKRIRPFIDGKDLYPEDYDLSIVFDSKSNRKKSKIMSKHHIEGLTIEISPANNVATSERK